MRKGMIFIMALAMLAGCAKAPDGVKSNTENSRTADNAKNNYKKIAVSELDGESGRLYDYISEQGYEDKFFLDEDIEINSISELYDLTLVEADDFETYFPALYSYLYGRDFYEDSGVKDISELPVSDEYDGSASFFIGETYGQVQFIDTSNIDPDESGQYTTSMYTYPNGAMYFENNADFFPSPHFKEFFTADNIPDKKYKMLDGSEWSLKECAEASVKTFTELYQLYDSDYEFKPFVAIPNETEDGVYFEIVIYRTYKGVPFNNKMINDPHSDEQCKMMWYECYWFGKDKLTSLNASMGTEKITRAERITENVIPVTSALDILNKELAANIRLEITDISMVYYNKYDSSEYAEASEKYEAGGNDALSENESRLLLYHDMGGAPGTEFHCYPVWEFRLKKDIRPDDDGFYRENFIDGEAVYVNAVTGEVMTYMN